MNCAYQCDFPYNPEGEHLTLHNLFTIFTQPMVCHNLKCLNGAMHFIYSHKYNTNSPDHQKINLI